ncbi:hypothetical protein L204_100751 [Cryptococcus depauperatus]|nr:glutathione transferase [Cryptococcus depauperatus CBS 7855]
MAHTITLHHLNASRSNRIFWVLEELNLPYKVQVHFRLPTKRAPPSLKQVSPLGRAPALELDGDLLTESAYIVHTLLSLPEVQKAAKDGEIDVQTENTKDDIFWSHFAEGSQLNLLQAIGTIGATSQVWRKGGLPGLPELSEEQKSGIEKYSGWLTTIFFKDAAQNTFDLAESFLEKQDTIFFSGTNKPGEGDFMMFFAIHSLFDSTWTGLNFNVGPNLKKWHETVLARPAAQRALEREKKEEQNKSRI